MTWKKQLVLERCIFPRNATQKCNGRCIYAMHTVSYKYRYSFTWYIVNKPEFPKKRCYLRPCIWWRSYKSSSRSCHRWTLSSLANAPWLSTQERRGTQDRLETCRFQLRGRLCTIQDTLCREIARKALLLSDGKLDFVREIRMQQLTQTRPATWNTSTHPTPAAAMAMADTKWQTSVTSAI